MSNSRQHFGLACVMSGLNYGKGIKYMGDGRKEMFDGFLYGYMASVKDTWLKIIKIMRQTGGANTLAALFG